MLLDELTTLTFSDGQPPDTRQDLTGLFTEKPQSGEVTVGECLHNKHCTTEQKYDPVETKPSSGNEQERCEITNLAAALNITIYSNRAHENVLFVCAQVKTSHLWPKSMPSHF